MTVSVQTGDRLVLFGATEDRTRTLSITTDGGQTWTLAQDSGNIASRCRNYAWTATANTTGSITVVTTCSTSAVAHGAELHVLRNSDGFETASALAQAAGDDPSFTLTPTQANTTILLLRTDWAANDTSVGGASGMAYRTGAGVFTETTYFRDGTRYTTANGYHADAGTAVSKTLGHTTTGTVTENWTYIAVGVKGNAGGATQQEASGTAAITTGATGAAKVTVLPSGTAAVTTIASGAGTVTVGASGTAAAAVAATGAATVTVRPSGTAAIATAATGAGTAKTETAGTAAVTTSAAGAATVKIAAAGSSAVTVGATGTATVPGAVQATGTAAITVTAAAAGTVRTNTTGTAALVTASTGAATRALQVSGASTVTSSATGSAKVSLVGAGTATVTFLAAGSPTTPAGTSGTASIVVQAFGAAQAGVTAPAGHIEPGDGLSGVLEGGGAAPVDWTLLTAGTVLGSGSRLGADIMSGPEPAGGLVGVVE